MNLTEDEAQILELVASVSLHGTPTVAYVMDSFTGPEVVGDDLTPDRLAFRAALESLCQKGMLKLPDYDDSSFPPRTAKVLLTESGKTWIREHSIH